MSSRVGASNVPAYASDHGHENILVAPGLASVMSVRHPRPTATSAPIRPGAAHRAGPAGSAGAGAEAKAAGRVIDRDENGVAGDLQVPVRVPRAPVRGLASS